MSELQSIANEVANVIHGEECTAFFAPGTNPAYPGVYPTKVGTNALIFFRRWDGKRWGVAKHNPQSCPPHTGFFRIGSLYWCGKIKP